MGKAMQISFTTACYTLSKCASEFIWLVFTSEFNVLLVCKSIAPYLWGYSLRYFAIVTIDFSHGYCMGIVLWYRIILQRNVPKDIWNVEQQLYGRYSLSGKHFYAKKYENILVHCSAILS